MDLLPFSLADDDAFANEFSENQDDAIVEFASLKTKDNTPFIAPFVPCPKDVAIKAVEFSQITALDILCDLGCGDGRLLSLAMPLTECELFLGVELDPHLAEFARQKLSSASEKKWQIIQDDMFNIDLDQLGVSVLILYLLPKGLSKLTANLMKWFLNSKQGMKKRVITIQYEIPGWTCKLIQPARPDSLTCYPLHLYEYPGL